VLGVEQRQVSVPFTKSGEWLAFGGAVLLVVGSFMTWAVAGPFKVAGTDGDGWFTLLAGVAAGVQAWRARWGSAAVWAGLGLGLVLWKFADLESVAEDSFVSVSPGGGLYLCGVGAAVCCWQSVLRWWDIRATR
jgi:hypothetical protein